MSHFIFCHVSYILPAGILTGSNCKKYTVSFTPQFLPLAGLLEFSSEIVCVEVWTTDEEGSFTTLERDREKNREGGYRPSVVLQCICGNDVFIFVYENIWKCEDSVKLNVPPVTETSFLISMNSVLQGQFWYVFL